MEDQTNLANMDSLLFQLALDTEELGQKKDDLRQQIQICKAGIQEKKNRIDEIQKTIKKLDEEILQRQNTLKCYKENAKSLRKTSELMLHYEKMLEAELEQRQQSYEKDMKMFQERTENYKKVFQQHKDCYCQNPLAAKLVKIQAENEEIEKRIQSIEEQIATKKNELKALKGESDTCGSGSGPVESNSQKELPSENDSYSEDDRLPKQDIQPEGTQTEQEDVQMVTEEKASENNQDKADGSDESKERQVGVLVSPFGSTIWTRPEIRCEQVQEMEQSEQETSEVDVSQNASSGAGVLDEALDDLEAEEQHESTGVAEDDGSNEEEEEGGPSSSPVQMTAMLDTPTFSLNSSPSTSVSHQERPGTPAFAFSMIPESDVPAFSGFGCSFDGESNRDEESPFTFTSTYFSNKKSSEPKMPGFLFNEPECHIEENFPFGFTSKSPQSSSSTQETGGSGEAFPFSFSFGKF